VKIRLLILSVFLGLLLAACGGGGPAVPEGVAEEVQFFNWTEYIDPEIYSQFKDETGIDVIESNFASNEEMLAKVQGGGAEYDLIVPSDYTVAIMIEEGLLAELDHDNIPNLANLRPDMQDVPYDPGNKYCVPYQWGTTGLAYNSAEMDEPESWAILFEPDPEAPYFGRTTMLDDPRESMAAALVYLGYDINSTDEAQLEEAKELLIQAKAAVYSYDSDQFDDLMASGESVMAHAWNGDILVAQEDNEDVAFTIPQEGGVIWIDNLCIPSTASPEGKLAAEMFINYLLDAEVGAQLSDFNWYASPNAASEELLDEEFLTDPAVYPPPEVRANLQYIEPLGEFESDYQRIWDEVKAAQ